MSSAVKSVGKVFGGGTGGTGVTGTGRQKLQEINIKEKPFQRKISADVQAKESRERQRELTEALGRRAKGEDSVAEKQIARERDRTQAARKAEAAGGRGRRGALAARTQARQTATDQQAFAREAGIAAAQERVGAQQALAQAIAQQRAQDISVAESDRAAEQALEQLRVQQRIGAFAPTVQAFEGAAQRRGQLVGGLGSGLAAFSDETLKTDKKKSKGRSKDFLEKLKAGVKAAATKSSAPKDKEEKSGQTKTGELIGKGIGTLAQKLSASSDRELKLNIEHSGSNSKDFLNKLESFTFNYKNPEAHGEGKQFGIMAQDLEKAGPVGRQMVLDTPEGKIVDFGKGFGAILASQVELNERLNQLEKKKKK